MDVLDRMKKEMFRRGLSHRTISTYLFYVRKFLLFCDKPPKRFTKKDCRQFLELFMERRFKWTKKQKTEITGSTLNVALNSLRFMMEEVLRKSMKLNIKYSKMPKKLPTCLTKKEITELINAITNTKHRTLISLMYGAGLRVSEALNLKIKDLSLDESIGWVRKGKGNKDRPFIIPQSLKLPILNLIKENTQYLFTGRNNKPLSVRTVQMILKKASKMAKLNKNVHPHTLRHSFATHVLESGADITTVQSLLGHNEARTTMQYLHITKPKLISIKSPLDELLPFVGFNTS